MTRRRRRHVRHDHIGLTAKPAFDQFIGIIIKEVQLMNIGTRNRFDLLQVDTQNCANLFARLFAQGVHAFHRNLTPAPRRTAQINNAGTGNKEPVLFIKLKDLERRTTAIALGLGAFDLRIVQLTLQPTRRRGFSSTGGFDLHRKIALSASACIFVTGSFHSINSCSKRGTYR
jgi:hypothetical protein